MTNQYWYLFHYYVAANNKHGFQTASVDEKFITRHVLKKINAKISAGEGAESFIVSFSYMGIGTLDEVTGE